MDEPHRGAPAGKPDAEVVAALARATSRVAADIHEQVEIAARAPPSQAWKSVVSGILGVGALVAWLAFPPRVDDADRRPVARVERDLKLEIASLAQQIEDFRMAHGGALPASLEDAGASSAVVQYTKLDPRNYELRGADRAVNAAYQSTQGLESYTAGLVIQGVRP